MEKAKIENHSGLFVEVDDSGEPSCCLGYLMDFPEHGVFSPDGKHPEITPEQADKHNSLLSAGEISGLKQCQVGQSGTFYYIGGQVKTFIGTVVAEHPIVRGRSITFVVDGKTFRGRLSSSGDAFNFRRIK
jgi:hypothetical protein